jgi:uncharacterized protein (TIGR00725 family)
MPRERAIIAVFGGNRVGEDVLRLAEDLGGRLAHRGHITLTGGRQPELDENVKDRALHGARAGPWIGISKSKPDRINGRPVGSGFAIHSGLDDRRNYLNAHLCDAAIALPGGNGTTSEAIFAMALEKPIVLVGRRHWREQLKLEDEDRLATWTEAVRWVTTKNEYSWPELDTLIDAQTETVRLRTLSPAPVVLSSKSGADDVLGSLLPLVTGRIPPAEAVFPVSHSRYREVAERLITWMSDL